MRRRKRLTIAVSVMLALLIAAGTVPISAAAGETFVGEADPYAASGMETLPYGDACSPDEESTDVAVEEMGNPLMVPPPPDIEYASVGSFVSENGKTYYYDENGVMAVNRWISTGGKRYFATRSGALSTNNLMTVYLDDKPEESEEEGLENNRGTERYYLGSDGSIQSGLVSFGGKYYYCDPNKGDRVSTESGWLESGGKRYFITDDGSLYANTFVSFSDTEKYCFGADGSVQSGIVSINGEYYFCDPANDDRVVMNAGFEYNGKKYYASPGGALYTNRFITFGDKEKYYVGNDGSVQSGIIYYNGEYYFCDPANGNRVVMNAGFDYNGKKYYASQSGALYTSRFISFGDYEKYYVGSDGSVQNGILYVNGKYYYADPDSNGRIAMNQWVLLDKKYYASSDGSFYTDCILTISNTEKYYVGTTGAVQTGINKYDGSYYYCDSLQGGKIVMNQWVEVAGNRYFASPTGAFYTSRFIHAGSTHYYMDSYGRVVREPFVIRGVTITPDPTTGAITQSQYDSIYDYTSPLPYDNYVLVDIPSQTLRYYVNGFEALFTYVVTGDAYLHPTPTGMFYLNGGKAQNVTLVGDDYETPVNYWMPFIGGAYGMHDATWRSYFGGTIYRGNGSHGCVNMPYDMARELYFMIPVGTMVIVR